MIVIWSGWGFLAGVVGFACLVVTQVALDAALHDERFYASHGWARLLSFWLAAGVMWPIGRALNRRTEHELLDPRSGRRVVVRSGGGHSLFFVPVQYWWVIYLILGVICAVA
jgi:hypothetical protein